MVNHDASSPTLMKVVYFDEESASDYLDVSAGGKQVSTSESVRERSVDLHAKVESKLAAKLSWLPFLGVSGEAGGGVDASFAGKSILSKTLSNTILTDYLEEVGEDARVQQLRDLTVTAPKNSMAYMKMFTPYMVMLKMDDQPVDFARLDEVLAGAKGYYELIGERSSSPPVVLRFNLKAFRNNYGLADLPKMQLVFHGILVGTTKDRALGMEAEMSIETPGERAITPAELVRGTPQTTIQAEEEIPVYDVILAGVEHVVPD